ncbi:MAG: DUF2167 domain-containing protein, partial [Pontiellaceae bacterium]|nr:DUF2167 domain-containing protein [Pontiellaceae bacterium]
MKWLIGIMGSFAVCASVFAQDDEVEWLDGPATGRLSNIASMDVPQDYSFTGPEGTKIVMEELGNLISGNEIGMIYSQSNGWFAVFEFNPCGYVKDDEKSSLDADELMKRLRAGQKEANVRLRSLGRPELEIEGWYKKPYYNEVTHNLEWCTLIQRKGDSQLSANHNIRILGRRGVTEVVLVADPDLLDEAVPELASILNSYRYNPGEKYAEYRKGDKIAKYGLTALVAGGAAAVAL